ncbi:MAG: N-formylglutamate amidohydrolase [Desulfofustis sp.]|nr:N-formylglutamate amidohydrolase [Desulfofustis sp.]
MDVLTESEMIEHITAGRRFRATVSGGAYTVAIARYVPAIVTAIHDGHDIPEDAAGDLLVSDAERRFEEDPFTGALAGSFAISLTMHHSRYYYDINRRPELCIYQEAWGKKIRQAALSRQQQAAILDLHRSYYRVLDALLSALEQRFTACVVYDLHSYNYSRLGGDPPLFNIGTHYISPGRFRPLLLQLVDGLQAVDLPGEINRTACDEVFAGKGYQAEYISSNHSDSLCIPIEIKKVFMDEATCALHRLCFDRLSLAVREVISSHARSFAQYLRVTTFDQQDFLSPAARATS